MVKWDGGMVKSGWMVMEEGRGWVVKEEWVDDVGGGVDGELEWGGGEEWVDGDGGVVVREEWMDDVGGVGGS